MCNINHRLQQWCAFAVERHAADPKIKIALVRDNISERPTHSSMEKLPAVSIALDESADCTTASTGSPVNFLNTKSKFTELDGKILTWAASSKFFMPSSNPNNAAESEMGDTDATEASASDLQQDSSPVSQPSNGHLAKSNHCSWTGNRIANSFSRYWLT